MADEIVKFFYVYNWSAAAIVTLLCSLLLQSIFKRKKAQQIQNIKKWKTNYAYLAGAVNVTFSLGYSYGVIVGGDLLATSLAFIMALHISCIAMSSVGSKKIFITSLLILVAPFIVILFLINTPTSMMLSISLISFIIILAVLSLSLHRSIVSGIEMVKKYENQFEILQNYKSKFEDTTFEDPLTGIFNRRFFDLMMCEEIRRAKRAETNLSIAIIEIDCFPEYLEHYGTDQGNKCIATIAKILEKSATRGGEFITRFEHNQFALIAPNVHSSEAIMFISKMVDSVNKAKLIHHDTLVKDLQQISISTGIAEFKAGNIIDVNEIINQAQSALKSAQQLDRNRIEVFSRKVTNKEESISEAVATNPTVQDFRIA